MKLQLDGTRIRLRLAEAELASLLASGRLDQAWTCPDGSAARCRLTLDAGTPVGQCAGDLMAMEVHLPREAFQAFAGERPRRDGFEFPHGPVTVAVEVDVRDSHRVRKSNMPPGQTVPG